MAERIDKVVDGILKQELKHLDLVPDEVAEEIALVYPDAEVITFNERGFKGYGDSGGFKVDDGPDMVWIRDVKAAQKIAITVVKEDYNEHPERFPRDRLEPFISVRSNEQERMAREEAALFIKLMTEEEIADYLEMDPPMSDEEAREQADTARVVYYQEFYFAMEEPVTYFVDELQQYTLAELLMRPWIKLDSQEAAESAVALDGWIHYLNTAEEIYELTPGGVVYFQD